MTRSRSLEFLSQDGRLMSFRHLDVLKLHVFLEKFSFTKSSKEL